MLEEVLFWLKKALGKNSDVKLIAVNHSPNVKRSIGSDLIFSGK